MTEIKKNHSDNPYGFVSGQKLVLLKTDSQTFYPQQFVKFLGLAKEPNQGTAIVLDSDGDFIIVRPEFLIDPEKLTSPSSPSPTTPKVA